MMTIVARAQVCLRWGLAIGAFAVLALPLNAQIGAQNPAADLPEAAQKPFKDALQYEQRKQLSAAVDSLHSAQKAAGGHCLPCLDALARVQLKMELYKDSAGTAAQIAKEAATPAGKGAAEFRQGLALYQLYFAQNEGRGAIDKNAKQATASLKQADAVLAQGETDDPSNEPLHMLHGRVLALLNRTEDADREFAACAAAPGVSPEECSRAQDFEKYIALARNEPAPAFTAHTMDGNPVSLDSLAGKVVLIDFWATWCKFCERDSDYVQSLLSSFPKDRFALLEVSVDEDEGAWKSWVKRNRLEGLQVHDDGGELGGLFHVSGYPTYIVLDGDGTVRFRISGAEGDLRGEVRKLLDAKEPLHPDGNRKFLPKDGTE